MDLGAYLNRIGFEESIPLKSLSLETLRRIMFAVATSLPFENLANVLGEKIILKEELIYEKIVNKGRGGWCCELNGLLFWALKQLGFRVRIVQGRVFNRFQKDFSNIYDHLSIVAYDVPSDHDPSVANYLVDCGLCTYAPPEPVLLDLDSTFPMVYGTWKWKLSENYWELSRVKRTILNGDEEQENIEGGLPEEVQWEPLVRFNIDDEACLGDFQNSCTFLQTPGIRYSKITTVTVSCIRDKDGNGFKILLDDQFITVKYIDSNSERRFTKENLTEEEARQLITTEFNIKLEGSPKVFVSK